MTPDQLAHAKQDRIYRVTLSTAQIRAFGAVARKSIQFSTPANYKLHLIRHNVPGFYAFTNTQSGHAKLRFDWLYDGDPMESLAIDVLHGVDVGGRAQGIVPIAYALGSELSGGLLTGFEIRSVLDTDENTDGPNLNTLDPEVDYTSQFELHFRYAITQEVTL